MVEHNNFISLPILLINIVGITLLLLIEGESWTSGDSNRTLKENSQLNYFHTNLRGSRLKIKINDTSFINNQFEPIKTLNENEKIQDKRQLRKLIQNQYVFYFSFFPVVMCLLLTLSFCAPDQGNNCDCNICEGGSVFFIFNSSNDQDYHHDHHHHHHHHHEKSDKEKENENICALICLVLMLVIIIFSLLCIISKACGKYASRVAAFVLLCISYGGMTIFYIAQINNDDYDMIYYLIGISGGLFAANLFGLFLPFMINCCCPDKPVSTITVEGPILD